MDHILVADDEKNIRNAIKHSLENAGYKVTLACNGEEGLKYFVSNNFKLVITDIKMPIMDGIEFARTIRNSAKPDIPIVAITAFFETIEIENGLFDLIIHKPFSLKYMKRIISQNLES